MTTDVLVFAAGMGTRMRHLVADRPKPMVPVAGRPLIDHALALTEVPGIGKRVVNTHYLGQAIKTHLAGTGVIFSDETDLLRDTGGGLRHAMPLLDSNPVMTLNSDAVWAGQSPVTMLLGAWRDHMDGLLVLVPPDKAHGHQGKGDFDLRPDARLERGAGTIYTGLQLIRPAILNHIPQEVFSMNLVWDRLMAKGSLFGVLWTGHWCDVGQPESIPVAEAMHDV